MTVDEAKRAIERNSVIVLVDEPDTWGTITCIDDYDAGVYYKRDGCGLTRDYALLENVRLAD